ncbi:ABC transporter ATP-binding protein [Spirochaetia bacterium 38H-sp]|uniref:ABC transporter ATP-binding protein n=1 Tax=Rarispira pelagica TaxID=3141764 RepID=A0ABU9UD87_9SPIR
MKEILRIDKLSFSYGKEILFKELSLSVQEGSIVGLLGENGAGKTTFLKLITGQLFPDKGVIDFCGYNPEKREPDFLKSVFYVPEDLQVPDVFFKEYVDYTVPFYPNFDSSILDELVKEFEVPKDSKFSSMSMGQKKKAVLAFAIASGTPVLILDEPTNGLDIPSKRTFRRVVSRFAADGRTFIISTHQVRDMERLIDPVVIIHKGVVLLNAFMDDIVESINIRLLADEPSGSFIYSEKVPGGYAVVSEGRCVSDIDLELLFNAVRGNPDFFRANLMQGGGVL